MLEAAYFYNSCSCTLYKNSSVSNWLCCRSHSKNHTFDQCKNDEHVCAINTPGYDYTAVYQHNTNTQWCIAKNGGGYTQTGMEKGLKVPCLFMIAQVSIRRQKNPGGWYTPYTRVYPPNTPLLLMDSKGSRTVEYQYTAFCHWKK